MYSFYKNTDNIKFRKIKIYLYFGASSHNNLILDTKLILEFID